MLMLNESNQIKGEHLYIDPLKTKCIIKKPIFSWNFYFALEIKTNQLIRMKGLNVKVRFVEVTFTSAFICLAAHLPALNNPVKQV